MSQKLKGLQAQENKSAWKFKKYKIKILKTTEELEDKHTVFKNGVENWKQQLTVDVSGKEKG